MSGWLEGSWGGWVSGCGVDGGGWCAGEGRVGGGEGVWWEWVMVGLVGSRVGGVLGEL